MSPMAQMEVTCASVTSKKVNAVPRDGLAGRRDRAPRPDVGGPCSPADGHRAPVADQVEDLVGRAGPHLTLAAMPSGEVRERLGAAFVGDHRSHATTHL